MPTATSTRTPRYTQTPTFTTTPPPNPGIGANETWRFYYYAGSQRIAVRVKSSTIDHLYYLFSDHLGSLNQVVDINGSPQDPIRYKPFGEMRPDNVQSPVTALTFTGQRAEATAGLFYYGARWYDGYLNRFLSPDSIVPSTGEGNNSNAIGYVANANYSALTVDYNEKQLLAQLNQENRIRLENPIVRLPGVPTNPLVFLSG